MYTLKSCKNWILVTVIRHGGLYCIYSTLHCCCGYELVPWCHSKSRPHTHPHPPSHTHTHAHSRLPSNPSLIIVEALNLLLREYVYSQTSQHREGAKVKHYQLTQEAGAWDQRHLRGGLGQQNSTCGVYIQ